MKAYNAPGRIGRAARSVQEGHGMEPSPMGRFCLSMIMLATLMLHGFEPPPCRAQTASPPAPLPPALPHTPIPPPRPASDFGAVKLKPAPLEPTDLRFPINLATALRLSDARPLIVAAAQASVWVAEAQLTRAKVLWVPTLMFGADYIRHDGGGPDFNKGVMTAEAYFSVHQYRGMYTGALYCVGRGHDLVDRISRLSRDLVPRVEVDRARNMVADLEQQATSAREMWRVHSANLTQVLRLDPRAVVVPLEHDHLQITMIDPALPLHDLQKIALTNRPELASYQALVQAAEARIHREKMRPLLPLVLIGGFQTPGGMLIQGGVFGLGPNSSLNQWTGRLDVSCQLVWQLDAF